LRNVTSPVARVDANGSDDGASLLIQGTDVSFSGSYAYAQVFYVNIAVGPNTAVQYSFFPSDFFGKAIAVDLIFTDGTTLRDSGAVDIYGVPAHPASQATNPNIVPGQWNVVEVHLYEKCKGKVIDKILVGYDQPRVLPNISYRAWIDHIFVGQAS
jgi:hypothetical protein